MLTRSSQTECGENVVYGMQERCWDRNLKNTVNCASDWIVISSLLLGKYDKEGGLSLLLWSNAIVFIYSYILFHFTFTSAAFLSGKGFGVSVCIATHIPCHFTPYFPPHGGELEPFPSVIGQVAEYTLYTLVASVQHTETEKH